MPFYPGGGGGSGALNTNSRAESAPPSDFTKGLSAMKVSNWSKSGVVETVNVEGALGSVQRLTDLSGVAWERYWRAIDPPPSPTWNRVEETSADLAYSGTGWVEVASGEASGGTLQQSETASSAVEFAFTGTGVRFGTLLGPTRGRAEVFLDGVSQGVIDTYGAAWGFQHVGFEITGLTDAAHTIRVVVLGTRNASSSANWVGVDFFATPGPTPEPNEWSPWEQIANPFTFNAAGDVITPADAADGFVVGSDRFDRDTADTSKDRRMFFNKAKGAIRAGFANDHWNDANVGTNSAAFGDSTTASGSYSHAEGRSNTASGEASHAEGFGSTASGNYSQAGARIGVASRYGQWTRGAGVAGRQISTFAATTYTTTADARPLTFDSSSSVIVTGNGVNVLTIPVRMAFWVRIGLVARNTGADEAAGFLWEGLIQRHTGNARIIGAPVEGAWSDAGAAGWTFAVSINTVSHYLALDATGEAGKNIVWTAHMDVAEAGG